MIEYLSNCYFEVEINNWDGGDHTWYTYKIFKKPNTAFDFMAKHKNQLTKDGWETTGKIEMKKFEDAEEPYEYNV